MVDLLGLFLRDCLGFQGQPMTPWGDEPRSNKMIFIGKNLDREELVAGFMACLAKD